MPWLSPFSALHGQHSVPKSSELPGSAAPSPLSFGEKDVDIPYEHCNTVPSSVFPVPLDIVLLLNLSSPHSKSCGTLHFPQAFQGGLLGSVLPSSAEEHAALARHLDSERKIRHRGGTHALPVCCQLLPPSYPTQ